MPTTEVEDASPGIWDDDLWEALLACIERERVIPVVGADLSTVDVGERRISIDQYVAHELQARLSLPHRFVERELNLNTVVSAYLRNAGCIEDLYPKIHAILAHTEFDAPEPLLKLARIKKFPLFVTLAYDSLMEKALETAAGPGGQACDSISYVPSDMPDCDLPSGIRQLKTTTVYHLLGRVSALPEYVISPDDLLEYVFEFQSDRQPVRLFDELKSHYLLFLGGNFSDWLLRFFLRLAKRQRLSDPRRPAGDREIVADEPSRSDARLVSFLANYSPQTKVFRGGASEFIDELERRWTARVGGESVDLFPRRAPGAPRPARRTIFISYSRQDIAIARRLKSGLESNDFNVWFDEDQMAGGQDFHHKIADAVNACAVFVPLISRNTERDIHDAYFRREWTLACERDTQNAERTRFIVPVIVDGVPVAELREVPERFLRKHILESHSGAVSAELVSTFRSALEERA
jgi:hypothetical protein